MKKRICKKENAASTANLGNVNYMSEKIDIRLALIALLNKDETLAEGFSGHFANEEQMEAYEKYLKWLRTGELVIEKVQSNLNGAENHFNIKLDNLQYGFSVSSQYNITQRLLSSMIANPAMKYFCFCESYDEEVPSSELESLYMSNMPLESSLHECFSDGHRMVACNSIEEFLAEMALGHPYGVCFSDWLIEGFAFLSVLAREGRLHEAPAEFFSENVRCPQGLDDQDYFGDTPLHLAARTGTLGLLPRELITATRLLRTGRLASFPPATQMDLLLNTLLALSLKEGDAAWLVPHLKTISVSEWSEAEAESGIRLEAILSLALTKEAISGVLEKQPEMIDDTLLQLAERSGRLGLLPREGITAKRLLSTGTTPLASPVNHSLATSLALSLKAGEADWLVPHLKTISASDWSEAEAECGIRLGTVLAFALPKEALAAVFEMGPMMIDALRLGWLERVSVDPVTWVESGWLSAVSVDPVTLDMIPEIFRQEPEIRSAWVKTWFCAIQFFHEQRHSIKTENPIALASRTGALKLVPREVLTAKTLLTSGADQEFGWLDEHHSWPTPLLAVSLKAGDADWMVPHLKTISASDWSEAEAKCRIRLGTVLAFALPEEALAGLLQEDPAMIGALRDGWLKRVSRDPVMLDVIPEIFREDPEIRRAWTSTWVDEIRNWDHCSPSEWRYNHPLITAMENDRLRSLPEELITPRRLFSNYPTTIFDALSVMDPSLAAWRPTVLALSLKAADAGWLVPHIKTIWKEAEAEWGIRMGTVLAFALTKEALTGVLEKDPAMTDAIRSGWLERVSADPVMLDTVPEIFRQDPELRRAWTETWVRYIQVLNEWVHSGPHRPSLPDKLPIELETLPGLFDAWKKLWVDRIKASPGDAVLLPKSLHNDTTLYKMFREAQIEQSASTDPQPDKTCGAVSFL